MLPKVATQIFHHTSRSAAVAHNQTIRNVLQLQSSSGNASTPASLPGRGGSGSNSYRSNYGPGSGGPKYNPDTPFQNGYTGAGRALTQANTSGFQDSPENDDHDKSVVTHVPHRPNGTRTRSHSLTLAPQPSRASGNRLAVLETVRLYARTRRPFKQPSVRDHSVVSTSTDGFVISTLPPPSSPERSLIRSSSTAVAPNTDANTIVQPLLTPRPSSPHLCLTDHKPPSAATLQPSSENPQILSPATEALLAARNSGDPSTVLAEIFRFRGGVVNPTVQEFNLAVELLCETRRQGDPLTPILETYNDMLKHSLLPTARTYSHLIKVLTDRDREVQKQVQGLESRHKRRAFIHKIDPAGQRDYDRQIAQLQSESNFPSALSIFEIAIGLGCNGKLPLSVYYGLIRSCSYHGNVDAAIRVFAQLEAREDLLPNATIYAHLIYLYANVKDIRGAQDVFHEFKRASRLERIAWNTASRSEGSKDASTDPQSAARASQLLVWNKMIEANFRCGQAAGGVELLEQMMDDKSAAFDVPAPASSTFTQIIAGFCQSGDVESALVWFDRLLRQRSPAHSSDHQSTIPPRPHQSAWIMMFDHLANAGMVDDLNRLFTSLLENAARDNLAIRPTDRLLVFYANMNFIDANPGHHSVRDKLDFVTDHLLVQEPSRLSLYDADLYTMAKAIARHYLNIDYPLGALSVMERFMNFKTDRIQGGSTTRRALLSQGGDAFAGFQETFIDISSRLFSRTEVFSFAEALRLMRVSDRMGLSPSRALSWHCLQSYVREDRGEVGDLDVEAWELLACATTTLELHPSPQEDFMSSPITTASLLIDMVRNQVDLATLRRSVVQRIAEGLFRCHSRDELQVVFEKLGENYELILKAFQQDAPTPDHSIEPPDFASNYGHPPIRIDISHSRFIDEFWPLNPDVSPLTAYARFEIGVEKNIYPVPATIGRLIGVLGRMGEIENVRKLYDSSQRLLECLEHDKAWQSQAWYHIEDQMIIAYAHAGDLDSAHVHRSRILEHGGAPTADAYGALIECVKDTTDDTSNALTLFQESQMHNVMPNIYLFNNIISKLSKARKADLALELFQQMKASRILPSSITYGAVIAACARVGDTHSAELLFTEMTLQKNFKPRIPPFNTMMQLYTHTKPDRQRVLFYYNSLLDANIRPTAHTYKLLMDAYGTIEPVDVKSMGKVFRDLEEDRNVQVQGGHWAAMINAWGGVQKDLDKAISIFESIQTHPSTKDSSVPLPDAITFEALINVFVVHRRTDLISEYILRLKSMGIHMTAYIANCLIRGYAAVGNLEEARLVFDSLLDPPEGVAAPNNHAPHEPLSVAVPATAPVYREPSTWEVMIRAELGSGHRDRTLELLERLQSRKFPAAVYNRIRGILFDDSPWPLAPTVQGSW